MRKKFSIFYIIIFIFVFIPVIKVKANERIEVSLNKCIDGDTANLIIKNKEKKVRFLAINTPESTNKIEEYGKEASTYTCSILTNSNKIEIEYDNNSNKEDKYGRTLAWIWVDDKLLQDMLIKEGLAEVKYLYGDYKYTEQLQKDEKIAQENKLNIWSEYQNNDNYYLYVIGALIIIVLYIFSISFRKKTNNKVKRKIKNKIDKEINNLLK